MSQTADILIDHMVWKQKIKINTFDETSFSLLSFYVLSVRNKRKSKSFFFKPDFFGRRHDTVGGSARNPKKIIDRYKLEKKT